MNEKVRILAIDDEPAIQNILCLGLKGAGYEVAEARTGRAGLELAKTFHPHLILLDLGLPDTPGAHVLKELRAWTNIPVIVLTVHDDEQLKVQLLDSGADDYLTKPFGSDELLARVRVGLRHRGMIEATPIFNSGELEVDLNRRMVFLSKMEIKMTNTEFEILSLLVRDHGKAVSQKMLLKTVWGVLGIENTHYLRIYINQLRKKLEKNPSDPKHILTDPGFGYRLV